jgi:BASS family bile acid:Na+ symporter
VYVVAIGLGIFGMGAAFAVSRLFRVHPVDARSIALEVGILNGPLAIAIILLTFSGNPEIGRILIVPAMYSLFIVIVSTLVTFWFRRANLASEQKIPNLL